jgi:hypothetical protein
MKLERASLVFALGFAGLGFAAGCTAYPTHKSLPLDCNITSRYQFDVIYPFDTVGVADLWSSADSDGGVAPAFVGVTVEPLPDGPRCMSNAALRIESRRNNDWGSLFGVNNFARNASEYEGLAFWARAPGNTSKAFTMLLDDPNTAEPVNVADRNCIVRGNDAGSGTGQIDPSTGMVIPGTVTSAPEPDQCGNSYSVLVVVTTDWAFYTIPFSRFQQGPTPNRVPNAALMEVGPVEGTSLLTSQLLNLIIRMPKEASIELWIDDLGFYRTGPATGGDGGVDAPQI